MKRLSSKSIGDAAICSRSCSAAATAARASADLVKLAEHDQAREVPAGDRRRIEAPVQQLGDLGAGEQLRGEVERLEVADDVLGVHERLARDALVVGQRACQRGVRQAAPALGPQRVPVHAPRGCGRHVGRDDVGTKAHGGLLGGVGSQRRLVRAAELAQRGGVFVAVMLQRAVDLLALRGDDVVEQDRCRVDVELQALADA